MAEPIENHAVIGDLRTTALVTLDGRIDFMCWPRFDSPTVFASLLDDEKGGCFDITPVLEGGRHRQIYIPDTNVLLTRVLSHQGVSEISDFMTMAEDFPEQRLVRRVKAVRGEVVFRMRCAPRFDYARGRHEAILREDGTVLFQPADADQPALRLCATVPLRVEGGDAVAEFTLAPEAAAAFILDGAETEENVCANEHWIVEAFKITSDYWRRWVDRSSYNGRWRDIIVRSSLALKLLTSGEHGSMVAAATFGLPEELGGSRNWDYRYTWIRDSSFMIYAFLRLGHVEEAMAFRHWLHRRQNDGDAEGQLQLMYGIDGRTEVEEVTLDHLSGFGGSAPVRIGNGAQGQLQLDIYGELMDAIYLSDENGEQVPYAAWKRIVSTIGWVAENWDQPDEGIWEVRGGRQHFLHSRVMCWVALDRGIRLARKRALPAPVARWKEARDAIYADVHENFWNEAHGCFVQAKGSETIDASCLLMPLVRFIAPTDPRWLSTLRKVGEVLVDDSLVYRYRNTDKGSDGLDGEEGTFTMCSFWYVECLARAGDISQARFLFDKMMGYANHVGLFSEELGKAGEHLGNFPQAFTHLALISAAYYLDRMLSNGRAANEG